jgi:RNA polymerase sigma-70 factor (ECF subfamily)
MHSALARTASAVAPAARSAAGEFSSDRVLIARIAEGDQLAMRTLFARHRTGVYRWLLSILGDEAQAEDLLIEVFLAVWQHAADYEARSSVLTWVLAIARHKALSARRQRIDARLEESAAEKISDPDDDPELALMKKNRRELLRNSLAKLSREHREIINLVYYHGRSVREASHIVGVGEATVKTRMHYARKRLASLLAAA